MVRKIGLGIAWAWLALVMFAHMASLYADAAKYVRTTPGLARYRSMACEVANLDWCGGDPRTSPR